MDIPSRELLEAATGEQFLIFDSLGQSVPARLSEVVSGAAMNEHYLCYSALLTLPKDTGIAAGSYQLQHPGGQQWLLSANPISPDKDGLPRIEILFHVEKSTQAD